MKHSKAVQRVAERFDAILADRPPDSSLSAAVILEVKDNALALIEQYGDAGVFADDEDGILLQWSVPDGCVNATYSPDGESFSAYVVWLTIPVRMQRWDQSEAFCDWMDRILTPPPTVAN